MMVLPLGILVSLALAFAVGACSVPSAQGQMMIESSYLGSSSGEKATGTGHFGKNPADMTSFEVTTDYFTRRSEEEDRERADREKRMRAMSNYGNMTQGGESYFDRLYYQPMVGAR
ncbi:exported protein of unknown function [Nitrospira japonica]|uniref:Lipoprotein n=1 Tax=Nitrospira japonica TaxID=1325564 RepID=A0A1W1I908_9BACT|nr:hypothetical protein [Nitrospira japonica]SLM49480.1 exported protein of unknown function [Nitrospira japonica]